MPGLPAVAEPGRPDTFKTQTRPASGPSTTGSQVLPQGLTRIILPRSGVFAQ
jgi:hypothetical protein